jgi:uncharacterized membrane protein
MEILNLSIWWLFLLLVGISFLPLSWYFFRKFIDLGYAFAKTIGLLLITYVAFLGGTFKFFPFSYTSLYLIFLFFVGVNLILLTINSQAFLSSFRKRWKVILLQEIFFVLSILLWSYVRAHAPEIRGLEKFMDYGFINSILKSIYFPPADMWFAGEPINYYWFGHLFVAVATKFSSIPSYITYNLFLGTTLGILTTGAFSLVATLFRSLSAKATKKAISAGVISLLLVAFAGNLHAPIYLIKNGFSKYWYPDATRFIGYFPETQDKTIHEFPIYSFVVSDLHAHLLDIPFVLVFLALIWSLASSKKARLEKIFFGGFLLGVMFMTNTWDFAVYSLAAGLALLFSKLIKERGLLKSLLPAFLETVGMSALGIMAAVPFILHFSSIAEGIKLVHSHSPLWQLGVLWGFPLIMTVAFLLTIFAKLKRRIKPADAFVLALTAASWILIIIPEIVFVKDIYIASHYRANTMFKLTYQAYVMFYLSAGYIALRTLGLLRGIGKTLAVGFFSILFTSLLIYPFLAVNSYYGGLKNFQGLSGETWLDKFYPETYKAIVWLRGNTTGQPVILEAQGNSYTDYNVISSYIGLPTVQGWFVHEWLWRGSAKLPQERATDVSTIYTTDSLELTKSLLKRYKVSYVIVGDSERLSYPSLNEEKFLLLGKRVFTSGKTSIYLLNN